MLLSFQLGLNADWHSTHYDNEKIWAIVSPMHGNEHPSYKLYEVQFDPQNLTYKYAFNKKNERKTKRKNESALKIEQSWKFPLEILGIFIKFLDV